MKKNEELKITFYNWAEMLGYLLAGNDLYDTETGDYFFAYNEEGAICVYCLDDEEAHELATDVAKSEEEYWGAFLGPGGHIMEDGNEITMCQQRYHSKGWVDTADYFAYCEKKVQRAKDADLSCLTTEELLGKLSPEQKRSIYEAVLADHIKEDVLSHMFSEDNYTIEQEIIAEKAAKLWVEGEYDTNQDYWSNIESLTKMAVEKTEKSLDFHNCIWLLHDALENGILMYSPSDKNSMLKLVRDEKNEPVRWVTVNIMTEATCLVRDIDRQKSLLKELADRGVTFVKRTL